MGFEESKSSLGYGTPPWIFKGSALYQFHLVKAETARAFIPKEFRLVEAFGYTLGGFFLAKYDDSPAGVFDELVVIAGIVWNPPTSCAWAARVLVNSAEACHHGRKDVGLPSQVATFSKRITPVLRQRKGKFSGFLNMFGLGTASTIHHSKDCLDIQSRGGLINGRLSQTEPFEGIREIKRFFRELPMPKPKYNKWMGPSISMSLPSFSGQTEHNPNLLKYSCRIACRVRAVRPAEVSGPSPLKNETDSNCKTKDLTAEELLENRRNLSISVMLSKPILALEFNCLEMHVEAPIILSNSSTSSFQAAA